MLTGTPARRFVALLTGYACSQSHPGSKRIGYPFDEFPDKRQLIQGTN